MGWHALHSSERKMPVTQKPCTRPCAASLFLLYGIRHGVAPAANGVRIVREVPACVMDSRNAGRVRHRTPDEVGDPTSFHCGETARRVRGGVTSRAWPHAQPSTPPMSDGWVRRHYDLLPSDTSFLISSWNRVVTSPDSFNARSSKSPVAAMSAFARSMSASVIADSIPKPRI